MSTPLSRINELLDELEAKDGELSVVLTGVGKFFSNGLDLARFGSNAEEFAATLAELKRTVGRLMLFPAYTVAALNGHVFAGGALMSCAFDYRVMREDRGYWCMNEAEIGLALDEQLWAIIHHRLPKATAIVAATTARRFGGPDALAAGIVEATAIEDDVRAPRDRSCRALRDAAPSRHWRTTSASPTARRRRCWALPVSR